MDFLKDYLDTFIYKDIKDFKNEKDMINKYFDTYIEYLDKNKIL